MPADRKLYDILGVSHNASDSEIKKAYYKLAKRFHPDKNAEDGDKFKEISFAYDVLSNPDKRAVYDSRGLEGLKEGATSGGFEDVFGRLFGGFDLFGSFSRGGRPGGRTRGRDVMHALKVTLEELYSGTTRKLEIKKSVVCKACDGRGGPPGSVNKCYKCHGRGIKITTRQIGPGMLQQIQSECPDCHGQGEVIAEADRCKKCGGAKVVEVKKTLEVPITPGMDDGTKIPFRGESDQLPGMEPGDVIIVLKQEPHPYFERKGADLFMKHEITISESLCGFKMLVKQLDGRYILVRHPAGDPIIPGSYRAVLDEGMPDIRFHAKGNLFIIFDVKFPKSGELSDSQIQMLEKLLPERPEVVIPHGEEVEEVHMIEVENTRGASRSRREAHDIGSDEDDQPEVKVQQCTTS